MPTKIQKKIAKIKKKFLKGDYSLFQEFLINSDIEILRMHADKLRPFLQTLPPQLLGNFMKKAPIDTLKLFADELRILLKNLIPKQLNVIAEEADIIKMMQLFPDQFGGCIPQKHKKKFESCFKKPADLKELDKYPVDRDHPVVAQSFCDTKILLPDGRIVTLENQFAGSVYKHFIGVQAEHEQLHKLAIYIDSWHAFIRLDDEMPQGFYPAFDTEEMDTIFAGLPSFGPQLGEIRNEVSSSLSKSKTEYISIPTTVTFTINATQFEDVSKFVNNTKTACENEDFNACTYNPLYRNCVIFTMEAFEKVFPGKHYLPLFRDQIPDLLSLAWNPLINPEKSTSLFERLITYWHAVFHFDAWIFVQILMHIEQIDAMPDNDCLHCLPISGKNTPETIEV